jgi:dihydrofolate reductase
VKSFVISRTLKQADHPDVTIATDAAAIVTSLKAEPGKDIWLFGGGELFRSLLDAGFVDGIDVGIIPVLLGGGIPLLAPPAPRTKLTLRHRRVYEKSGVVGLEYDLVRDSRSRKGLCARPAERVDVLQSADDKEPV